MASFVQLSKQRSTNTELSPEETAAENILLLTPRKRSNRYVYQVKSNGKGTAGDRLNTWGLAYRKDFSWNMILFLKADERFLCEQPPHAALVARVRVPDGTRCFVWSTAVSDKNQRAGPCQSAPTEGGFAMLPPTANASQKQSFRSAGSGLFFSATSAVEEPFSTGGGSGVPPCQAHITSGFTSTSPMWIWSALKLSETHPDGFW